MNGEDPTEFDDELRRHFAGALDPQRGRALRAFEEQIHVPQHRRHWLMAASIGLVFLAGAAVAFWPARRTPVVSRAIDPVPPVAPRLNMPQDVTRLVAWEASDEGVVDSVHVQGREIPVRKVRREAVETTQWFDPASNATIRLTVPVEQTILIQEDTY
jgi:hypothetical protein